MKALDLQQMENLTGWKFWGWSNWNCNNMGVGQCFCNRTYFTFWIGIYTDYMMIGC